MKPRGIANNSNSLGVENRSERPNGETSTASYSVHSATHAAVGITVSEKKDISRLLRPKFLSFVPERRTS